LASFCGSSPDSDDLFRPTPITSRLAGCAEAHHRLRKPTLGLNRSTQGTSRAPCYSPAKKWLIGPIAGVSLSEVPENSSIHLRQSRSKQENGCRQAP